jgi:general secretion pathway protein F
MYNLNIYEFNNFIVITTNIKEIYSKKLNDMVKKFALILAPLLIGIMGIVITWLILAIFTPIWDMNSILF